MSNRALLMTYLNLSGEMFYIIQQRLCGQKVEIAKREKGITKPLLY
jgi:hypothetical protein